MLFGVPYIDFLKKKMVGQYIREEAPENHKAKEGAKVVVTGLENEIKPALEELTKK